MKRLPPAIQEKQRYLKFRVHAEEEVDLGETVEAIWAAATRFLGVKGCSCANFWIIGGKFNEESQEGVVRVNRSMENDFRAALATVEDFEGKKGFIEVKKVSGTLESLD